MSFIDRMRSTIAKGYENASKVLDDASKKAKEMGERALLEYEIRRLEKEVENEFTLLGSEVYSLFEDKKLGQITQDASEAHKILKRVKEKEEEIRQKDQELEKLKK